MLSKIHRHVDDRIADFARTRQVVSMIAITPESPALPGQSIHNACDAGCDALNAAGHAALVRGFDDKMDVIALHAEVRNA
jgi:hypothetical protein